MNKETFFLRGLTSGAYQYKAWVIHCFSHVKTQTKEDIPYLLHPQERVYTFYNPETKTEEILEGVTSDRPAFHFREPITLTPETVANVSKPIETTYGRALANQVALVYPFGDKIAFIDEPFNIKRIEKELYARLTTDECYQDKTSVIAKNPIYVSEYLTFIDAILSLEGYTQLCVPSATEKTMTHDPAIDKRREELLDKYRAHLDDPAVVARVEAELIAMDKAWMKGDLGEGFYQKEKFYNVVRKKTHLMHGYEAGFEIKPEVIENSLSEGWDIDKLPAMVNSLREGTYGRAHLTQLGGEATKFVNRMMQNTKMTEQDCGTTEGWERVVTEAHIGFYYIDKQGKTQCITKEEIKTLLGKTVKMRSPQWCKTPGVNYCRCCIGEANAENANALSAHAAAVGSQLMYAMMGLIHGKPLVTARLDINETLR